MSIDESGRRRKIGRNRFLAQGFGSDVEIEMIAGIFGHGERKSVQFDKKKKKPNSESGFVLTDPKLIGQGQAFIERA